MDLANSWHKVDIEQIDKVNDRHKGQNQNLISNANSKRSDGQTNISDMITLSSDLSVAIVRPPEVVTAPITHRCGARLPNGTFCQRQDRYVCPFHGKIVERDDTVFPLSGHSELVERMFGDLEKKSSKKGKRKNDQEKPATNRSEEAVRKRLQKSMRSNKARKLK